MEPPALPVGELSLVKVPSVIDTEDDSSTNQVLSLENGTSSKVVDPQPPSADLLSDLLGPSATEGPPGGSDQPEHHVFTGLEGGPNAVDASGIVPVEKQGNTVQLQKLNELIKKPNEEGQCCAEVNTVNCCESVSDKGETIVKSDSEGQVSLSIERSEHALGVLSDDDSAIKTDYFGLEDESNLMSMVYQADGSLSSPEDLNRMCICSHLRPGE